METNPEIYFAGNGAETTWAVRGKLEVGTNVGGSPVEHDQKNPKKARPNAKPERERSEQTRPGRLLHYKLQIISHLSGEALPRNYASVEGEMTIF